MMHTEHMSNSEITHLRELLVKFHESSGLSESQRLAIELSIMTLRDYLRWNLGRAMYHGRIEHDQGASND